MEKGEHCCMDDGETAARVHYGPQTETDIRAFVEELE